MDWSRELSRCALCVDDKCILGSFLGLFDYRGLLPCGLTTATLISGARRDLRG